MEFAMRLPPFEYHEPSTLQEACTLTARFGSGGAVIAGGTDLLVNMKNGGVAPTALISIGKLKELREIETDASGVSIGAAVSVRDCIESDKLTPWTALVQSARELGTPLTRNLATVGGNVMSARPSADLLPVLMGYGGVAFFRNVDGERKISLSDFVSVQASNKSAANSPVKPSAPVGPARMVLAVPDEPARGHWGDSNRIAPGKVPVLRDELTAVVAEQQYPRERLPDFFVGPGRTVLGPDFILTKIHLPSLNKGVGAAYVRLGTHKHRDINAVNVGAWLWLDGPGGSIVSGRIVLGAVGPAPRMSSRAAEFLRGKIPGAAVFEEAGQAAMGDACPIDDHRGSAEDKRSLIGVLTARALHRAWTDAERTFE
jgi:CO/xanthine dehydrogenase FAD-binding subunit